MKYEMLSCIIAGTYVCDVYNWRSIRRVLLNWWVYEQKTWSFIFIILLCLSACHLIKKI